MKKLLLVPAVAAVFALASCSHKASEATVAQITEFETAWTAAGQQATTWSEEVKATTEKATEAATKAETTVSTATNEAAKTQLTELATTLKNDKAAFEGVWNEYTAFQQTFEADTKAFTEWKEKVNKGEVNDEEAVKAIAEYNTKLADVKTKIETWTATFNTAKETFAKNNESFTEIEKTAMEPVKEEKKGNKKS